MKRLCGKACRAIAIAFALFGPVPGILALNWPVDNPALVSTFGGNEDGRFCNGVDLGGGEQAVKASAAGEILFESIEGVDLRDLPSGLGSFVVVDHGDGVRTLYSQLKEAVSGLTKVEANDPIGVSGDSGNSVGIHLHFEVISQKSQETLNPLLLLPKLGGALPPTINAAYLERSSALEELADTNTVAAGQVNLVVDASQQSPFVDYADPMAPLSLQTTLNGNPVGTVTFTKLQVASGHDVLGSANGLSADDLFLAGRQVRLGTFALQPGTSTLEIVAADADGNIAKRTYVLEVEANP